MQQPGMHPKRMDAFSGVKPNERMETIMVVYLKDSKGRLKTFQDLAFEHNLPTTLIYSRYLKGMRDLEQLTQPRHQMLQKNFRSEAK